MDNKTPAIESDESSSSDDSDAELLTDELEEGFFKVLSSLKKKDNKLYDENAQFFPSNLSKSDSNKHTSKHKNQVYKEWLKGQKATLEDAETTNELSALHDFWANTNKDEQFLRDYILNKKFLDPDDSFSLEKELNKLSEEEKEEEEHAMFEEKYNLRYENPDQQFLEKYPQTMKKAHSKETDIKKSKTKSSQKRNRKKPKREIQEDTEENTEEKFKPNHLHKKPKISQTESLVIKKLDNKLPSPISVSNNEKLDRNSILTTISFGKSHKKGDKINLKNHKTPSNLKREKGENRQKHISKISNKNNFKRNKDKLLKEICKPNQSVEKKHCLEQTIKQPGTQNMPKTNCQKKQKDRIKKMRHRVLHKLNLKNTENKLKFSVTNSKSCKKKGKDRVKKIRHRVLKKINSSS